MKVREILSNLKDELSGILSTMLVSERINKNHTMKLKKQKNLKTEILKFFLKSKSLKRKIERQNE